MRRLVAIAFAAVALVLTSGGFEGAQANGLGWGQGYGYGHPRQRARTQYRSTHSYQHYRTFRVTRSGCAAPQRRVQRAYRSPCAAPPRVVSPCGVRPCAPPPVAGCGSSCAPKHGAHLVPGTATYNGGLSCTMPDGRLGVDIGIGCIAARR